ncbi:hypothetical protein M3Y99_00453200 [Aphelenchoides fujianensis]|nr:hypothetical protein M3Y99_00453200 [Aphelenchoides fujianensis]
MGNLLTVVVQFDFHFVDGDARKHFRAKAKIRRRSRLTDALALIVREAPELRTIDGAWRTVSYSAAPAMVVDACERVRRAGTVVVYLEPDRVDEKRKAGIEIAAFTVGLTFDVRLNHVSIARYAIRVPAKSTVLSALNAFVRAHSCCSPDFEVAAITSERDELVSGCDRVRDRGVYVVELKSKGTLELSEANFVISYKFLQNDEEHELQLECRPEATVADLKQRLRFLKIDGVYFADDECGALVLVDAATRLVPDARYWIDVDDSGAEEALKQPLTADEHTRAAIKPEIMAPAGVSQSMILRRNAGGVQMQMGSLFDSQTNRFVSVHLPLDVLKTSLSRRSFGNARLKTQMPSPKAWTLVNPQGEMLDGEVDSFGVQVNSEWDTNRLFYFVYECRTGILSIDLPARFYEHVELGTCTHALNSAVMGVYFVVVLYFRPSELPFDRKEILEDLIAQLMSPKPEGERPPLSDRLHAFEAEQAVEIGLYVPDILDLQTPQSIAECRQLVDSFKVPDFKEVQLEHWFLPLHQIVPLERLGAANIVPYEQEHKPENEAEA